MWVKYFHEKYRLFHRMVYKTIRLAIKGARKIGDFCQKHTCFHESHTIVVWMNKLHLSHGNLNIQIINFIIIFCELSFKFEFHMELAMTISEMLHTTSNHSTSNTHWKWDIDGPWESVFPCWFWVIYNKDFEPQWCSHMKSI